MQREAILRGWLGHGTTEFLDTAKVRLRIAAQGTARPSHPAAASLRGTGPRQGGRQVPAPLSYLVPAGMPPSAQPVVKRR